MALVKCVDCGNEVSTSAASCPKCGAPGPAVAAFQQRHKHFRPHLLGAAIAIGLGMIGMMGIVISSNPSIPFSAVVVVLIMGGSLWALATVFRMNRPQS